MGRAGAEMRLHFVLVACLLVAATADIDTLHAVEEGNCPAEAKAATAQCQAQVSKTKALADKVCKGRNYKDVMKKVARLKRLAERQEAALKRGEAALAKVRANAARLAKLSGKERAKLLAELAKQKTGKKKLSTAEKKAAEEDRRMKHMRAQADAALLKAVDVAKKTGDKGKIKVAKDKAHGLYRKMVDEKIRIATVHHEVIAARKELAKISALVEKEIGAAKKVAQKEASALKTVAQERANVAGHKLKEAQNKAGAASVAEASAVSKEKALLGKINGVNGEIAAGRGTVKNAKNVEDQAKKAEGVVKGTKVSVGPLSMPKLKEEAKRIASGQSPMPNAHTVPHSAHKHINALHNGLHPGKPHSATIQHETSGGAAHVHVYVHSHGVKQDVHNQYAEKVKKIEKERLQAKAIYHSSEAKLAKLKSAGASPGEIAKAQSDVNTAAANMKKFVAAQHSAVMQAVNAVKGSKP